MTTPLNNHDLSILRQLAEKKAACAQDPVNRERRQAWYNLDGGKSWRPMVLAEFAAVCDDNPPLPKTCLQCQDAWARDVEWLLRSELWQFEQLQDDHVIEPWINTSWQVQTSDFGVQKTDHSADNNGKLGARSWEPALKNLDTDFARLRHRTFNVAREASLAAKARLEAVFAGILPVRFRGQYWWTMGMTITAIDLIGLENLMLYMFDNPEGLHRLMSFLRDDALAFARWLENEGLFGLNNENDYIGSGSMGYTRDLPQEDAPADGRVRMKDLWVLLESQETVGVGPELFETFIFPYQNDVATPFGKCYYGCCEPVNNRWHVLQRLPNLARVSVSPWADEAAMAANCGTRTVYSRKPNPTLISTPHFDEAQIREDLRKTLSIAGKCRLEIIMKDVHTLSNDPNRMARWVQIAREEIAACR